MRIRHTRRLARRGSPTRRPRQEALPGSIARKPCQEAFRPGNPGLSIRDWRKGLSCVGDAGRQGRYSAGMRRAGVGTPVSHRGRPTVFTAFRFGRGMGWSRRAGALAVAAGCVVAGISAGPTASAEAPVTPAPVTPAPVTPAAGDCTGGAPAGRPAPKMRPSTSVRPRAPTAVSPWTCPPAGRCTTSNSRRRPAYGSTGVPSISVHLERTSAARPRRSVVRTHSSSSPPRRTCPRSRPR